MKFCKIVAMLSIVLALLCGVLLYQPTPSFISSNIIPNTGDPTSG